ncbi:MAG TPA: hypothetical protein VNX65_05030 [Patescibacteria group bacterium]|jgi:hypothetical protein|nr:hypothetical protein [Patescibacteria group bacterium]
MKIYDFKSHARPILIVLAALVAITIGTGGYLIANGHNSPTPSNPSESRTTLAISSEPAGVQIGGNPECDSSKLHKVTPYNCVVGDKILDTIMIAPYQTVVSGKTYMFATWDGCSVSNADKKVCRVTAGQGQTKNLKATYVLSTTASGTSPSTQPSSSSQSVPTSTQPAPSPSPTPAPPTNSLPDNGTTAQNQCQNSIHIDSDKNVVTCSVVIAGNQVGGQTLYMGLEWVNTTPVKDPPITATCTHAVNAEACTLYKGGQSSSLALNTPTVVNSDKNMGGPYPGPNSPSIAVTSTVSPTTVSFSFPYKYSLAGKDFSYAGLYEYNNTPSHTPNYYLNWKYKAN